LQAINRGIVVATDGARELLTVDQQGDAFRVQPPAVSAIDATGAGDAFRAGLLAGLLKDQPLPRAVCWGVAAGALKVQHLGAATGLPSAAEVVALADTLATEDVS
jgi:ribokinase